MKKHVFTENAALELLYSAAEECGVAEELSMLDYNDAWDRATEFACEYDPEGDNATWHNNAELLMNMYGPQEPSYAEDIKKLRKAGFKVVKEDRNSKGLLAIYKMSDILEKSLDQIKKVKVAPIENINECEDATSAINTCAAHLKEIAKVIKTVKGAIPEVSIPDQAAYQAAEEGDLGGETDSEPAPKPAEDETVEVKEESVKKANKRKPIKEWSSFKPPYVIYEKGPGFEGYLDEYGSLTDYIEEAEEFTDIDEAEEMTYFMIEHIENYVEQGEDPADFTIKIISLADFSEKVVPIVL